MQINITRQNLKLVAIMFTLVCGLFFMVLLSSILSSGSNKVAIDSCLPAFRDGGGPYYKPNVEFRKNIVPTDQMGQRLKVSGYILNEDCSAIVSGAILDIWQASEEGEYEDEYYRGKVETDANGYYEFETVVPQGYGEGTAYRPPHIHFKVFIENQEIVTSQMFFSDVRGRDGFEDEYIIDVTESGAVWNGSYNIVLPGV